jgi:SAM-dependent methyltransferase
MAKKTRDIATVFGNVYFKIAPKVLRDIHEFLLRSLESHFQKNPNGTLLVVGPGGHVLPYSCSYAESEELGATNRDRIGNMIGDGHLILLDYVIEEAKGGLKKGYHTLNSRGFFEDGYFNVGQFNPQNINSNDLEGRTISFLENNLREPLRIESDSLDAIDANISVHHASVTRAELERIYSDFYRVLKVGGLLHLGEGNTDMNYSEDKTIRIGQDLTSILNAPVFVSDEREKGNGYEIHSFFEPNKTYDNLPVVDNNFQPTDNYTLIRITEDGLVVVKATAPNQIMLVNGKAQEVADKLHQKGYAQTFVFSDSVTLPLIDPEMPEDVNGQIIPVDEYYDAIKQRVVKGYAGIDDQLVAQMSAGIEFERGNARRATVEYYMGEKTIVDTLNKIGFSNIQVTHHETEPFYNITADKTR